MLYMVTCAINIPPMLAYIPYMDPMGYGKWCHFFHMPSSGPVFSEIPSSRLVPSVPVVPW